MTKDEVRRMRTRWERERQRREAETLAHRGATVEELKARFSKLSRAELSALVDAVSQGVGR